MARRLDTAAVTSPVDDVISGVAEEGQLGPVMSHRGGTPLERGHWGRRGATHGGGGGAAQRDATIMARGLRWRRQSSAHGRPTAAVVTPRLFVFGGRHRGAYANTESRPITGSIPVG